MKILKYILLMASVIIVLSFLLYMYNGIKNDRFKRSNILIFTEITQLSDKIDPSFSKFSLKGEHKIRLDLIATIMKTMQARNVACFITFGTLLGSLRHHDFIPWDEDTHLGAPMMQKSSVETALLDLMNLNYLSKWRTSTLIRIFSPSSQFNRKTWPNNWPYVDIDLYFEDANFIWFDEIYKHPKMKVFPLHKRPLGTIEVNSPHDGFDCLTRMFNRTDMCFSGFSLSPDFEIEPRESLPCAQLATNYSFVHRYKSTVEGKILEILKFQDKNISTYLSDEPAYIIHIPAFNFSKITVL